MNDIRVTVTKHIVHAMDFGGETYWRFGNDDWFVTMGESIEPVCNSDRAAQYEALFQGIIKNTAIEEDE